MKKEPRTLGGRRDHNRVSGVAHFAADSDEHACGWSGTAFIIPKTNLRSAGSKLRESPERNRNELIRSSGSLKSAIDIASHHGIVDDRYFFEVRNTSSQNMLGLPVEWPS